MHILETPIRNSPIYIQHFIFQILVGWKFDFQKIKILKYKKINKLNLFLSVKKYHMNWVPCSFNCVRSSVNKSYNKSHPGMICFLYEIKQHMFWAFATSRECRPFLFSFHQSNVYILKFVNTIGSNESAFLILMI